jgi:DNA-directed RNA polymerase specialized sigma24 family protein
VKLYKAIYIDRVLGLHLGVRRRTQRLALKQLWWRFRKEFQEGAIKGLSYEEIAKRKAFELYGMDDLEEVGRRILEEQLATLPRYDGEYPSVLIPYIE